jgi:hypothetical protein
VVCQQKVFPLGDFILQPFDGLILKFFNPTALHTHDMIVVAPPV